MPPGPTRLAALRPGCRFAAPSRSARSTLDSGSGVFLGEPLVEVARSERIQEWIGVSFGPSFRGSGFKERIFL